MPEISDQPALPARIPDSVPPQRTTDELWVETGVVLALAVLPDLFYAFSWLVWPQPFRLLPFVYDHLDETVRSIAVSIPVLYLIWRSGEPWSAFGLSRPKWMSDVPLAVLLWVIEYLIYYRLWGGISPFIFSQDFLSSSAGYFFARPKSVSAYLLLSVGSLATGFSEELVMRGYLIPRFERLLRSTWASLVVTSLLFASYHVYQGIGSAIDHLFSGLLYGGFFCLFRRLWPVVFAHALFNIVIVAAHGG
jgi:membrane protease YdiL (CAAX protease family)